MIQLPQDTETADPGATVQRKKTNSAEAGGCPAHQAQFTGSDMIFKEINFVYGIFLNQISSTPLACLHTGPGRIDCQ
jgi:hypothetical protein